MTRAEAIRMFEESVLPQVIATYGVNDRPARDEAWNNWTDMMAKDGEISWDDLESWDHPYPD